MREAIGSSLLFNLIITFVIIMIAFLIGSLAYSKAFKVKNRIINIIEKNEGNVDVTLINQKLSEMGYKVDPNKKCSDTYINGGQLVSGSNNTYRYCIYKYTTLKDPDTGETNDYYKVITYMYFDIPVVGMIQIPVEGETKVFYDTYINYEV